MSKTQIDGKPVAPVPANIPEELVPVYEWFSENGKSLVYQLAIIILVAVVALAFMRSRTAKLENASAALLSASDVTGLEDLNAHFGGTKLGPLIRLRLARAYYDEGQFDSAKETYGAFVKGNGRHALVQEAKLGYAASQEALQEFQQAIESYRGIDAKAGSPISVYAKMGEARSLAASGDKAAAREIVESVAAETKGTVWEGVAENLEGVIDRFDGFREKISFADQLSAVRSSLAPADMADVSAEIADEAADEPEAADDQEGNEEGKEEKDNGQE